jgi:hypothetical protein
MLNGRPSRSAGRPARPISAGRGWPAESAGRSQPIGRPAGQIGPADTIHQILGFLRIQMNFRTIQDLIY